MRKIVSTDRAPGAVGPYSQAVAAGGMLWASGQIALDPSTGTLVSGGTAEQTRQALANLAAVLEAGGSDLARAVKVVVYLTDLGDFETMNRVYEGFFRGDPPARVCVEVSRLPKDARVEVEAVALLD